MQLFLNGILETSSYHQIVSECCLASFGRVIIGDFGKWYSDHVKLSQQCIVSWNLPCSYATQQLTIKEERCYRMLGDTVHAVRVDPVSAYSLALRPPDSNTWVTGQLRLSKSIRINFKLGSVSWENRLKIWNKQN